MSGFESSAGRHNKGNPMAMNKAERKELEDARAELRIYRALRWTEKVLPDVHPPESDAVRLGYSVNVYAQRVEPAWTETSFHGAGHSRVAGTASYGGNLLYSTRLLAFKALRSGMEERFARELASVDDQIRLLGETP